MYIYIYIYIEENYFSTLIIILKFSRISIICVATMGNNAKLIMVRLCY